MAGKPAAVREQVHSYLLPIPVSLWEAIRDRVSVRAWIFEAMREKLEREAKGE